MASCLNKGDNATLGILHFSDALEDKTFESKSNEPIEMMVKKTGKYVIEIYKDGILTAWQKDSLTSSKVIQSLSTYQIKQQHLSKLKRLIQNKICYLLCN